MALRALVVLAAVVLAVSGFTGPVSAVSFAPIVVPGTSDLWLAGMPNGSTASGTGAAQPDIAPTHSPVLIPGLSLAGGSTITFAVTGAVSNSGVCCDLPEGSGFFSHVDGVQNGIANVNAPINSLVGVFLSSSQPSLSGAPSGLDFSTLGLNFSSLAPGLKQPFFIGDGRTGTGSGAFQSFIVPDGATRLFLGTMDSFEWANNSGEFTVFGELIAADLAPTPEPATLLLFAATAAGLGWARRKRSAS